jgi:hypothetical protein
MKLVYIFGPRNAEAEGLWAVQYPGDTLNIFEQIFKNWMDSEWMFNFCCENIELLKENFGPEITPETGADELMDEVDELEKEILDASLRMDRATNLQSLFKPLDDMDKSISILQCSKAKVKAKGKKWGKSPRLRIYAIRINATTYVVTGGAIKLTHKMKDSKHTSDELKKIKRVQAWLKSDDIAYPEDLKSLS